MKYLKILVIFTLTGTLTMCELHDEEGPDNKITGTGPLVTKTLNLQSFNKIENSGVADFYITRGNPQSVVLKSHQNIIDVMTYEVINDALRVGLKDNTSIEYAEEIRFDITVNELVDIKLIGVGYFELSGDFQDELIISLTGVGDVNAYDMEVGNCKIVTTGVGDCKVFVRDELDVLILGVGNVYYKGNPGITQNVTGVGSLINDN